MSLGKFPPGLNLGCIGDKPGLPQCHRTFIICMYLIQFYNDEMVMQQFNQPSLLGAKPAA